MKIKKYSRKDNLTYVRIFKSQKKSSKYVQVRTHCVRTSEDIGTDSFSNS